ncbi:MAG TPA: galactose oxidase-like domain-containing protein [Euzebyales bacterium]|nr:galactose oxidase-like domain-containing protein [Euzebyales bacterium]
MCSVRPRRGVLLLAALLFLGVLPAPPASAAGIDDEAPAGPVEPGAERVPTTPTAPARAHVTGAWSPVASWPLSAIHAILLPDGKVLTYGTNRNGRPSYGFTYDVWDPVAGLSAGSHTTLPVRTATNLFCSAQTVLADSGQVLITGGDENGAPGGRYNDAIDDVNLYDPDSNTLRRLADSMGRARWYPTVTTLPNGEVLVHGGRDDRAAARPVLVPEVYSAADGWRRLTGAVSRQVYGAGRWWYPRSWVAPNGRVFIVTKGNRGMYLLDTRGAGAMRHVGTYPAPSASNSTPAAMFDVGKVLITRDGGKAAVIDLNGDTPKVRQTGALHSSRAWSNATVLANGEVLVTGGASRYQQARYATRSAEIWNPGTGKWRRGASAAKARLYHSTALLLPDATVLTAGGGPPGPVVNLNAEIYAPPYLFRRDGSGRRADRPGIAAVGDVTWGGSFDVDLAGSGAISKVALVRTGSVTHSFDMDQRYMTLGFTQSGASLRVAAPANRNVAPPGQYMLFVFDGAGVPSVAEIVHLGAGDTPAGQAVQAGSLTLFQSTAHRWVDVAFRRPFERTPVVAIGAASSGAAQPAMARIRNVTTSGFQIQLEEWDHLDGRHGLETLSFVAAEPGRHSVGGVTLEAGALTADGSWRSASFSDRFGAAPIVLPQLASAYGSGAATVRLRGVNAGGFQVRLQAHEARERTGRRRGEETVHYIALSPGRGAIDGRPIVVGVTRTIVTQRWHGIAFGRRLAHPTLVAAAQTTTDVDPAIVRSAAVTATGAKVRMQEERSHDRELRHGAERVGWVAIGAR